MSRRSISGMLGVLLALALALALPVAAASPPKTPVSGADTLVRMLDEGRTWESDGIQHVRGWTAEYATVGTPSDYIDGTSIIVANWNLDLATGDGTMWGTTDHTLRHIDGSWHETWVAKFDAGVWSGWGVGRGTGAVAGMKIRLDVWSTGVGVDAFEGFIR